MNLNRRNFLSATVAAGVAMAAPSVHGAQKNRKYKTALIGSGWWGMNILRTAIEAGESDVVALCDVDGRALDKAAAEVEQLTGKAPTRYRDYRELLDREKPEIAVVATPDHWHALPAIAAVAAEAHVYVEKPISHTIEEGRAMVAAARAADRVVQVGTHRRVSPSNAWGIQFLKEGRLGRVGLVRAFVYGGSLPGQPTPDADPPPELDWDMWCGPAPLRPFNPAIHPKGFRQYLDYANGTLGDWGIHWLDHILWWSEQQYPTAVCSTGGRHIGGGNGDAPDTQVVEYQFDGFTAVWEHRQYGGTAAEKHPLGIYFYGTEGTLHIGWKDDGSTFYPRSASRQRQNLPPKLHQPDSQNIPELWADFLRAIRSGGRPACDIEIGHRSTTLSLLGMLSLKLGRSIHWDGQSETCPNDPEGNALLRRDYRKPWVYPEA